MKSSCSDIVNRLVQNINKDGYLEVSMEMIGSGARNLITQNANEPIDLDYNLIILYIDGDIRNTKKIKEYVRIKFNEVLATMGLNDCEDSKSALTTKKMHFKSENRTNFSIDLAIVYESNDGAWHRLIHEKTGYTGLDKWYWNEMPQSSGLRKKIEWIKNENLWLKVREAYLNKKNMYLRRRDTNHPSFICYIEAVNEVFNKYR